MNDFSSPERHGRTGAALGRFFLNLLILAIPFFLVELLANWLLTPADGSGLAFGALWAFLLAGLVLFLPRKAGRITFGILYFLALIWTLAQCGYYHVFGKMMWLSTISFADEGATFLGDVVSAFPGLWWIGGGVLLLAGVLLLWRFPNTFPKPLPRTFYLLVTTLSITGLCFLPELVFQRDNEIWGTHSEYGQAGG